MSLLAIVNNLLRRWETGHFVRNVPPALGVMLFVTTEPFLASSFFSTVNILGLVSSRCILFLRSAENLMRG